MKCAGSQSKGIYTLAHYFINTTNGTRTLISLCASSPYSTGKLAALKLGEYPDLGSYLIIAFSYCYI